MSKKNMVIVLYEQDHEDNEQNVIGVCTTLNKCVELMREYYGEHKLLTYQDIRDSNLEWTKVLEVKNHRNEPYKVSVTAMWFCLDEV